MDPLKFAQQVADLADTDYPDDIDWGDDEPIVASCDLENPGSCESCQ